MGMCVCFENKPKDTPCIGDESVCKGPLGECNDAGVCIPQKNDDGCPCDDNDCTVPENACVDPDFKCICKGGACVANYLPPGGPCVPSTYTEVGVCEEAICVKQETLVRGTPDEVVCKVENKPMDTPCMGDENDVCQGPLGKCNNAGVCDPQPDEDGCPCADKCTVPPDACVDPDFNCICEGGACVVNYLPAGVSCDPSTTDALKQCQEATCVKKSALVGGTSEVLCEVENRPDGTACSGDDVGTETTCENAGKCAGGMCLDLQCENPEPAECTTLGDVCYDTSFGQGLCCLDLDDFSGPLQCVKEDRCPCGKCSQDGFDDNTAYCAFNAGNDETACTASCRSCDPKGPLPSVGSVFDEKACNNANSCDSISGVNVYCPQGQICVACKPANTQSAKPEGCQAA
jgi:hypothetical protein